MMSFYEEFGVSKDASVEEIRQAYKTLARVLHPDSQTEEKLRTVAACQMKRLHEILDILVDPGKRRAYNESLAAAAYPNAPSPHWTPPAAAETFPQRPARFDLAQSALQHGAWILMVCMILGSGLWYLTARIPIPAESVPHSFSTAPSPNGTAFVRPPVEHAAKHEIPEPVARTGLLPAAKAALPNKTSVANLGPPALPDVSQPMPGALPGLTPTASYSVRQPKTQEPENASPAPKVRASSFAGEWFYVPAIEKPDPHLYPPVDIDLHVAEKDGLLNGQYRGRYKVPDVAVSQDVVFQVQGKSSTGAAAALTWASSDGANGEIDLNLVQPNLMKVTWWTTRLGSSPILTSGIATLVRQQEQ
jgi:hypothetical protein